MEDEEMECDENDMDDYDAPERNKGAATETKLTDKDSLIHQFMNQLLEKVEMEVTYFEYSMENSVEIKTFVNQRNEEAQKTENISNNSKENISTPLNHRNEEAQRNQENIANIYFENILQNLANRNINLSNYEYFDFYLIAPKFISLEIQTLERLKNFIRKAPDAKFLENYKYDSKEIDKHLLRNASGGALEKQFNKLINRMKAEKDRTIFFVVHDEAHYAPVRGSFADKLINDPYIQNAENVILLQVTATPYSLITKNSRIETQNQLDMFKLMEENKSSSNYYGIDKFIEKTKKSPDEAGTFKADESG